MSAVSLSQRLRRTLAVCVALAGCDAPTADRAPLADPPVAAPAATPSPPEVEAPQRPEPVATKPPTPPTPPTPPPPVPKVSSELKQTIGRSINELTIDLQRKLAKQPGNIFVSGMSVAVGLSMLHAGSGGATARELAKVLEIDQPTDALYPGLAGLVARWTHPSEHIKFVQASSLFGRGKLEFKPEYADRMGRIFSAPPGRFESASDIDTWVRTRTDEKIGEVWPADALADSARLVAATVASFEAEWFEPFDPAATTEMVFHTPEHKHKVPMMRSVQRLPVAFGLAGKLRVLEVPFKGGEYSMVIVLSGTRGGFQDIEKGYDADKLQSWLDSAKPAPVELMLPRFTVDFSVDLSQILQKLGAVKVFDPKRAELTGMTGEKKLALASLRHRARITVAEHNTEGAATPPAIDVVVGGAPTSPTPFIVDHPFLFYIRDVRSGVLLFYGRVMDPTAAATTATP